MSDSVRFNNLLLAKVNKVDAGLNEYNQKFPVQVNEEVIVSFLDDKPITCKDRGEDFIVFVNKPLDSEYSRNKIGYSRNKNGQSAMNIFRIFLRATGAGTYSRIASMLEKSRQILLISISNGEEISRTILLQRLTIP